MNKSLVEFLQKLMERKQRLPSQLARDIKVSHVTVLRWLKGSDIPNITNCQKLAVYSGVAVENILRMAAYLPETPGAVSADWPEFAEYARKKYPELDEDLVHAIEQLIERKR